MSNLPSKAVDLSSALIVEKLEDRIADFMNRKDFLREVSFAVQLFKKNNQLQKATSESALQAIMNVAQVGLTLNPVMKLAYLVPRWDRAQGGSVVALEPSYQGLVKLLTDTGSVKQVYSHLVYDGDDFEVMLGTTQGVNHKPKFKSKNITHVYAVAELTDGMITVEVMDRFDVDDIMELSESYKAFKEGKIKSCVWDSHYGEMARKTVIRRLVKYLPKSDKFERVAEAISLDESDWQISDGQYYFAEGLINKSTFEDHIKTDYEMRLAVCSRSEYEEMITELQNNQIDPISAGKNYNASDIRNKLKLEV